MAAKSQSVSGGSGGSSGKAVKIDAAAWAALGAELVQSQITPEQATEQGYIPMESVRELIPGLTANKARVQKRLKQWTDEGRIERIRVQDGFSRAFWYRIGVGK